MTATNSLVSEIQGRLRPHVDLPDAIWGFVIDGAQTYTITVSDGVPAVAEVAFLPPSRRVTIYMAGETLSALMAGRLEPMMAYFTRKIRIDGQLNEARKLSDLFA